jgi:hypothetical protein
MFCDAPRPTMYSSHAPKPSRPDGSGAALAARRVDSVARSLSFTGPSDEPSPWMAVVMPCVTIEIARPSPVM